MINDEILLFLLCAYKEGYILMNIVENIKNAAKKNKMTLTELERLCHFPKSSIRKWNDSPPSILKVYAVSQVLDITIDEIVTGEYKSLTNEENEILNMYRKLPSESKTIIKAKLIEEKRLFDIQER